MEKYKLLWYIVPKRIKENLLIGGIICMFILAFLCLIGYWLGYSDGINTAKTFYEQKMINSCYCWG